MSARDILPFRSSYGGHNVMSRYPVNTTAAFLEGEPVLVEAAGTLIEAATLPSPVTNPPNLIGIAAAGAANTALARSGSSATPFPTTMLAPVYMLSHDAEFVTRNVFNNSDALVAPTLANVGDRCALRRVTGPPDIWGVDFGAAATTLWFQITDVLDSLKRSIRLSGAAGVFAVFRRVEKLQE